MKSHEAALDEMLDALRETPRPGEPDCALCRRAACSVERGLKTFFAEFVNDPQVRDCWRGAQGFCAEHAAHVAARGDALAVAILYSDLARLIRERMESTGPLSFPRAAEAAATKARSRPAPTAFAVSAGRFRARVAAILIARHRLSRKGRFVPAVPCPACTLEVEAEARYASALAAGLAEMSGEVWDTLERGGGLCIAHVEQVIETAAPAVAARLRSREAERLAALQAELEEIVRKNDYRFRGEPWGPEKDAWLRALRKLRRPRT